MLNRKELVEVSKKIYSRIKITFFKGIQYLKDKNKYKTKIGFILF